MAPRVRSGCGSSRSNRTTSASRPPVVPSVNGSGKPSTTTVSWGRPAGQAMRRAAPCSHVGTSIRASRTSSPAARISSATQRSTAWPAALPGRRMPKAQASSTQATSRSSERQGGEDVVDRAHAGRCCRLGCRCCRRRGTRWRMAEVGVTTSVSPSGPGAAVPSTRRLCLGSPSSVGHSRVTSGCSAMLAVVRRPAPTTSVPSSCGVRRHRHHVGPLVADGDEVGLARPAGHLRRQVRPARPAMLMPRSSHPRGDGVLGVAGRWRAAASAPWSGVAPDRAAGGGEGVLGGLWRRWSRCPGATGRGRRRDRRGRCR